MKSAYQGQTYSNKHTSECQLIYNSLTWVTTDYSWCQPTYTSENLTIPSTSCSRQTKTLCKIDPLTAMQGCIHFTLPAVLTFPRSPVPGLWMRELQLTVRQVASCSSHMGTLLVWKLVQQHFFTASWGTALWETGFTRDLSCKRDADRSILSKFQEYLEKLLSFL